MASVIKIKNSTGSGANTSAPINLAQGEMAYSFSNNTLVIGTGTSGTNVIIGGAAYVGNYDPTTSTLQNISNIFGLASTPLVIKGTSSQVVNIGSTGVDTSILGSLSVVQTANVSALAVTNGATFSGVTSFSYANGIGFKDVNDTASSGASPSYFIRPSATDLTTSAGIKTFYLPIIAGTTTTTSDSLVSATSTDTLTNKIWNSAAIGATYGGTGVANNVASTITISGAFATTLTVGATTALTLPATGTLATLAGSESFTNKTGYNGLLITANTGVITSGTWNGTVIGVTYGGTGVSLAATGGPNQFVRQSTSGGNFTVSAIAAADLPGTFSGFGTPAASFGLGTAAAGSATTAMRSDATLVLSQAIAPSWTGKHIYTTTTSATVFTAADNLIALNTGLAATASTVSNSPYISLQTNVWNGTASAAQSFNIQNQNTTAGASTYQLAFAAGSSTVFTLSQSGNANFSADVKSNNILLDGISVANALTNKTGYNGLLITANTGVITSGTWNAGAITSSGAIAGTNLSASGTLSVATTSTFTGIANFVAVPTCSTAPTGDTQLVNKLYVDTVAQGLHVHPPADVILLADLATTVTGESTFAYASPTASTTTITITGTAMTFTVDSVLMANWTRIVIAGESSTTASTSAPNKEWHGIYTKSTSTTTSIVLTRAVDADYVSDLNGGDFVFIQSGTIYADTGFVQTVSSALGTIAFASANGFNPTFVQFSQAGVILAGNGLTKSANTLTVVASDASITVASGGISVGTIDGGSF